MRRQIAEKVVIVTGASSGIGRATAVRLGKERARVVVVGRREARLEEVVAAIRIAGGTAIPLALDLRRKNNIETMISETRDHFGRLDVLINNAGFGYFGTVENTPLAVMEEIFELNFEAPMIACQLAIPMMRAQGNGHIINISSIAGKRGLPLSGIYCSTKFALHGLSEALRIELKGSGIDVSIVNPAATATEFQDEVRRSDVVGRFKPMGHVQSADEVAGAILECIKNPRPEVYPYRLSRFVTWANAIAPSLVDRLMMPYFRDRMAASRR